MDIDKKEIREAKWLLFAAIIISFLAISLGTINCIITKDIGDIIFTIISNSIFIWVLIYNIKLYKIIIK